MDDRRMFALRPLKFYKIHPKNGPDAGDTNVPEARSGHRIVTDDNGDVYSFGGYNPRGEERDPSDWSEDNPIFKVLWKFHFPTQTWKKIRTDGDNPKKLASHCCTLVDGTMIVYGGTGVPFGSASSNSLYTLQLPTLTFREIKCVKPESTPYIPRKQYGQSIAVDKDEMTLYCVGGTNGYLYTIDVHKFDLKTRIWTRLYQQTSDDWPDERYRHELVMFDRKLFVFGGGTADKCFDFVKIPAFDLRTNKWTEFNTHCDEVTGAFPDNRRCHGCVQVNDSVYIVGGTTGANVCSDLWRLNMLTGQWTQLTVTIPLPVYFHGTSASSWGQMTLFGGVTSIHHDSRSNEMYTVWVTVPPLKEIAWLAMLYYSGGRRLSALTTAELYKLGIPLRYINRLKNDPTPETISAQIPRPF